MAEAILFNIAGGIISKLASPAIQETKLWWAVQEELDKLRTTVSTIQAVLLDAKEKYSQSHEVRVWVESLKEAFYDADDLLDEFSTDVLLKQMMTGNKMVKEVRLFFSSSNQFAYGLKMAHKIKKLRSKLDGIAANKKFLLNERPEKKLPMFEEREQTHSSLPQVVVGREKDKKEIVDFLLSSSCGENVSIISIVGIGGLGKTTLAQLAYNDETVKSNFELKMWVCISDNFDIKIIVEKILESLVGEKPKNLEMNTLKDLLCEKINGKKYLLVLDDLWNENSEHWFCLKDLLVGGRNGSKIIVTTRLKNVAEMIRSEKTHDLQGLLVNDSWSLFANMAFKLGEVISPDHERIGKEIVAKCVGVPLAIRVIGRLLYSKNTIDEWQHFKEKELPSMNKEGNSIMQTLILSYNHLPSHLKCCFAYCRLFPKDYKIKIPYLVRLWIAQGFIKSSNSEQSLQDIGLEYFKDLLWRSFFQEVEENAMGNLRSCKMHDLMHDLAGQVAGDETILLNSDAKRVEKITRHLSINVEVESWQKFASCLSNVSKVRTFTSFSWSKTHDIKVGCDEIFSKLSHVRALDLCDLGIKKVPHSIDKLKHIRFLDLSHNRSIEILPDSIIKLQNLQTLNLINCERLKHIKKLVNLQQLWLDGCVSLTHMPRGIGQLTALENLSVFMVAKDMGVSKRSGGLGELRDLNKLGGNLEIMNLRYVKNPASEFEAANLKEKQRLQSLTLSWKLGFRYDNNSDGGPDDVENDEEMSLEELRPHINLKWLIVSGCGRLLFPSWISSLTNLVGLRIDNCKKCQHFPPLDQFPSLKRLTIKNLTDLEYIESGISCDDALLFPSLESLRLLNCTNLKGWRRDTSTPQLLQFHCLYYLEIKSCPNLTSMPLIPSVQHLVLINASKKSLEDMLKMKISVSQSISSCSSVSPSQLKILQIENIEDLEVLPEDLWHLPSLEGLLIKACEELDLSDDIQWQYLRSLREFQLINMNKLAFLPKGLQHVPTLRKLSIESCPNLKSLPEWMESLTAIEALWIEECPQLSERCKNNLGADWPKIAHIPNISIDDRWINVGGCYKL